MPLLEPASSFSAESELRKREEQECQGLQRVSSPPCPAVHAADRCLAQLEAPLLRGLNLLLGVLAQALEQRRGLAA